MLFLGQICPFEKLNRIRKSILESFIIFQEKRECHKEFLAFSDKGEVREEIFREIYPWLFPEKKDNSSESNMRQLIKKYKEKLKESK